MRIKSTAVRPDNRNMLVCAGCYAAAAQDALGVFAHQVKCGIIIIGVRHCTVIAVSNLNTHFLAEGLEFAVAAALAGKAAPVLSLIHILTNMPFAFAYSMVSRSARIPCHPYIS